MQDKIKHIFSFLFNFGLDGRLSGDSKRLFRLVNQICFCFIILASPYYFIFSFFGLQTAAGVVVPSVISYILCLIINILGFIDLAGILLIFSNSIIIFYFSSILTKASGAHYVLFALVVLPIALFGLKKIKYLFLGMMLPIISLITLELTKYSFFAQLNLDESFLKIISILASLTTFSIIILAVFFSYKSRDSAEQKLHQINKDLQDSHVQLLQAFQELKQSKQIQEIMSNQAAYSQLVNGVAHEFKNPLHLMRARAEVTLERSDLDEDVRKLGNAVIKQVDRLDAILKPMLIYGRQNMSRKKSYFDLKEIVDDLSELAAPRCRKSKIEYIKPDILPDVFVAFADKDYVFQSVLNVLVNALQFTHEKGFISLNVGSGDYIDPNGKSRPGVWISVTDNGDGIDKDKIKTIFEPYSTSKKDPKNVGLGLSIVFRAIMENEGTIDVESERGQGTLFRLWVPTASLA